MESRCNSTRIAERILVNGTQPDGIASALNLQQPVVNAVILPSGETVALR